MREKAKNPLGRSFAVWSEVSEKKAEGATMAKWLLAIAGGGGPLHGFAFSGTLLRDRRSSRDDPCFSR